MAIQSKLMCLSWEPNVELQPWAGKRLLEYFSTMINNCDALFIDFWNGKSFIYIFISYFVLDMVNLFGGHFKETTVAITEGMTFMMKDLKLTNLFRFCLFSIEIRFCE
jgi:hypothetical protein